jgi:hypothetical protein|tara:strand:- start:110 stop:499 length:390 start_codon:yes stop_codon:yes gene_type:complete
MNPETLISTLIVTIIVSLPLYYVFQWAYLRDMKMRKFRRKLSGRYNIIPFIYKYQLVDWCLQHLGGERHTYSKLPKKALIAIYKKEMNGKKPREVSHSHKKKVHFNQDDVKNGHPSSKSNGLPTVIVQQ